MTAAPRGRDLFIVDNSVSGWTGLRYLEEWTGIAKGFDVATGYFEIGALLALDGKWQQLEKIRILMGAATTHRTRRAILDAVKRRAVEVLDSSIEPPERPRNRSLRSSCSPLALLAISNHRSADVAHVAGRPQAPATACSTDVFGRTQHRIVSMPRHPLSER
jgi:hypothetical protein